MPLFHLTLRESPEGINKYQPMSGNGYKRTLWGHASDRPPHPRKRTSSAQERFRLKKRTLDVCFTPESGHS